MWRYRGTPHYLRIQAQTMGIAQILADRSRNNPEIYHVSVLLAQLCERYHKARKQDGRPVFGLTEREQIRGTLEQCELELQKLHMLAATADAMMAEAWVAFDLEPPKRTFKVQCCNDRSTGLESREPRENGSPASTLLFALTDCDDQLTLPLGDGTVGAHDDEPEPASSRGDQWSVVCKDR